MALEVAVSQLGVCEEPKGSNTGKEVDEYLKSVGLGPGYAWCMAFVYWCFLQAVGKLGIKTGTPVPRTAGVMSCYNAAVKRPGSCKVMPVADWMKPTDVQPGDQFVMRFAKGNGHTGIIERAEYIGGVVWIHTIEGNTNDDGSREGYEVARRKRKLSSVVAVIRYC